MTNQIKLEEIYDKNINILIGSGASSGLFPTLALRMKNGDSRHSIETIATLIEQSKSPHKEKLKALLFMHYYKTCVQPITLFDIEALDELKNNVIENYKTFLKTILSILSKRRSSDRRCNLFTTNYDGCLALTADKILKDGKVEFIINDGTRGFRKKYLQAKNFNSYVRQTGVFALQHNDLQQINLIHLHGSAYWYKDGENIVVDYNKSIDPGLAYDEATVDAFSSLLENQDTTFEMLEAYASLFDKEFEEAAAKFLDEYNLLPIVNPTKWKFYETVFEEHYYQMLRAMSYELEKPNTVFITFGFSFADEHILNLVKRSLSNPSLQLFVCCFNTSNEEKMRAKFIGHENVQFITSDIGDLDFSKFNSHIFTLNPPSTKEEE
ncbi:SIR2 family protein [Methylotenera sp.]|uniref:SIR2 family protein n=1 Tax=Methylotenera sp. TaxID=2051956 RepID=UPI0027348B92|nr:SIR2 family protein [Methylotenera sp.]MDP3778398.1 SIR2 family protein [Methylotenera sp.]